MSVIVTKVRTNDLLIASDSIRVWGTTQEKIRYGKLFTVNDLVVGAVGHAEETGLYRIFLKTHRPAEANEDEILDHFSEFQTWLQKRLDVSHYKLGNTYHLITRGRAFKIVGFYVNEITAYDAIGAGRDFALGALALGHSPEDAVRAACEHSTYCELPLNTISIPRWTA